MLQKVFFKNLEPTSNLQHFANYSLGKVMDLAPYGSLAVSVIEKQDNDFRCSIDIHSAQGPFTASAVGATALDAIQASTLRISQQIEKWRKERFKLRFHSFEVAT